MRTPEEIKEILQEREESWAPVMAKRMELRDAYNGDIDVPLPELDRNEKVAVANLIAQGLDQIAMRVASTVPDVFSPPLRPGIDKSEKLARLRRHAALGWMEANELDVKLYRRSRHLLGYAASPILIRPDPVRGIPSWNPRNPLSTYPAPMDDPDEMCPTDCLFTYIRSLGWLKQRYPEAARRIRKGTSPKHDDKYKLVEYCDYDQMTLLVVGKEENPYDTRDVGEDAVVLEQLDNRAGMCLAVVPQRITLDRPQGQFDQMIGLYVQQAMLMALEVIAVKKGVLPTTVIESFPNAPGLPELVTGDMIKPGWTGEANIIKNGTIKELVSNPGYQTFPTIDRLERAQRLSGGVPPEFGGESGTNIRTGRRGDSIISATVDFVIQENQRVLSRSQRHEMTKAVAVDKAWFGSQGKSFYVSWGGVKKHVDYVPNEIFEDGSQLIPSYANAGSDVNSLNIALGQLIGTGMMSMGTGREMHPFIEDPEREHDRTVSESLERALLTSIEQQAAAGAIPPNDLARIMELVQSNKMDLAAAITKAQEEAQARQASSGPPGSPEGPVDPMSPEAQPGLAQPGMGAEAGVEGPMPNVGDLGSLLMQLRGPQLQVASERNSPAVA